MGETVFWNGGGGDGSSWGFVSMGGGFLIGHNNGLLFINSANGSITAWFVISLTGN